MSVCFCVKVLQIKHKLKLVELMVFNTSNFSAGFDHKHDPEKLRKRS